MENKAMTKKFRFDRSDQGEVFCRRWLLLMLIGVIVTTVQIGEGARSLAQTISENSPKYNSSSAGVNHLILGLDYLKAGTPDDLRYARQNFVFIINMTGENNLKPIAYLNLGTVELLEQSPGAAIKNFLAAIELDPKFAEAYFNLGSAYYKLGNLKKAEESFLKAIELQPEYGRAHYSLGFVYFDLKKYDLAKKHAEKAMEYGVSYKTLKEKLVKLGR